jgi:Spy/CpxP family protein refolding chaperone
MKTATASLTATLLLAATAVWAQDAPKRDRGGPGGSRPFGLFGMPAQMGEKLNLDDKQKQKALEIAQKYRPQLEEIRKKMIEEFRGILNDEQKKRMDEGLEQLRQRFQQGRGEGGRKPAGAGDKK